jgi:hypothetical protein
MKKAKAELDDWGRSEYKRSDLGKLVRGKYAERVNENPNVMMFDPEVDGECTKSEGVAKSKIQRLRKGTASPHNRRPSRGK